MLYGEFFHFSCINHTLFVFNCLREVKTHNPHTTLAVFYIMSRGYLQEHCYIQKYHLPTNGMVLKNILTLNLYIAASRSASQSLYLLENYQQ